nr:hypothetical protein [Tanacetum cinerariifolium]
MDQSSKRWYMKKIPTSALVFLEFVH